MKSKTDEKPSIEFLPKNNNNNHSTLKKVNYLNKTDLQVNNKNHYKPNHNKSLSKSISNQNKNRLNDHRSQRNKSTAASLSKRSTSVYLKPYKFENYNIQQMTYGIMKDFNQMRISKEESFMERMKFDIYKRQIKEERVNQIVAENRVRRNENERIQGFNRLIQDANRRTEALDNLEKTKTRLDQNLLNPPKRYKAKEWKDIYDERFKRYREVNQKKLEMKWKEKIDEEMIKEDRVLKLCKTKKSSMKEIEEGVRRLYEEAIKTKAIKLEKKRNELQMIDYQSNTVKTQKKIYNANEFFFVSIINIIIIYIDDLAR